MVETEPPCKAAQDLLELEDWVLATLQACSLGDLFWCKMAAQRGWSVEEIENKLLEVSEKARERARCGDGGNAHITALNATASAAHGLLGGRE